MHWVIGKLGAAFLAGVGWKLAIDAYDLVKLRMVRLRASRANPGPEITAEVVGDD
jgi:hypothetical protein